MDTKTTNTRGANMEARYLRMRCWYQHTIRWSSAFVLFVLNAIICMSQLSLVYNMAHNVLPLYFIGVCLMLFVIQLRMFFNQGLLDNGASEFKTLIKQIQKAEDASRGIDDTQVSVWEEQFGWLIKFHPISRFNVMKWVVPGLKKME